jgi:multiple antibiotic resistance protein
MGEARMFEGLELREWNEYVRLLVGLLALINPLTVLPIFLGLVQGRTESDKRHISTVAAVTVLVTLLIFTYFGGALLDLFAITVDSFRIAGGILLLLTALEMMRAKAAARAGGEDTEVNITSIGIVPLGIPLLAGPGAIVTTIVDATALPGVAHKLMVSAVVVLVAIVVYVALRLSAKAGTYMSPTAMTIFNRVMGLIIASIAIEFMLGGLAARFPILTQVAP